MTRPEKPSPALDGLSELLAEAAKHKMTPAEIEVQRQSWVRGMTTPCEHGLLDFEQCPDCRKDAE